ncbi:MAG: (d)CMP kinase [Acutalibacteraceae bacterium]
MISIALDGPAGAGKSTIAHEVAARLGYIYVDTGALYRAVALAVTEEKIDINNKEVLQSFLDKIDIAIVFFNGEQHVLWNDRDISKDIRTEEISKLASNISKIPEVRAFLLDLQRDFAKRDNVIMDGRDIGTVVLPGARVKIFLTASPEIRAERRYRQLLETNKADGETYESILEKIRTRDYNDSHRDIAPLKPAEDAVLLDTTDLTLSESIEKIIEIIRERI